MQIGQIIRKFRKEKNLTQEQLAVYLGVTASAVNKWEHDVSYPDITQLSPLAKILGTDVNTLLAYQEELSDTEVILYAEEVARLLRTGKFADAYEHGQTLLKTHSGCEQLTLLIAQLLNAGLQMLPKEESGQYRPQITAWLEQLSQSNDATVVAQAASSLCLNYLSTDCYEQAQAMLDRIPSPGYDKRPLQGALYIRQESYDSAQILFESMLHQAAHQALSSLQNLFLIAQKQNDTALAQAYARCMEQLPVLLELGDELKASVRILTALEDKDEEKFFSALEQLIQVFTEPAAPQSGCLYRHLPEKNASESFSLAMIKKALSDVDADSSLDFIKDRARLHTLAKRFETAMEKNDHD